MIRPETIFFQAFIFFLVFLLLYTVFIGSVYFTILIIKELYKTIKKEIHKI